MGIMIGIITYTILKHYVLVLIRTIRNLHYGKFYLILWQGYIDTPMNMFPFIIIILTGVRYAHVLIWNNYVGGMCHFPVYTYNK